MYFQSILILSKLDLFYSHMRKLKKINPPPNYCDLFLVLQVALKIPLARDIEVKLPLVILLGDPKPRQQNPKRSICFRKLCG